MLLFLVLPCSLYCWQVPEANDLSSVIYVKIMLQKMQSSITLIQTVKVVHVSTYALARIKENSLYTVNAQ